MVEHAAPSQQQHFAAPVASRAALDATAMTALAERPQTLTPVQDAFTACQKTVACHKKYILSLERERKQDPAAFGQQFRQSLSRKALTNDNEVPSLFPFLLEGQCIFFILLFFCFTVCGTCESALWHTSMQLLPNSRAT